LRYGTGKTALLVSAFTWGRLFKGFVLLFAMLYFIAIGFSQAVFGFGWCMSDGDARYPA
jgi:hypothetical protein